MIKYNIEVILFILVGTVCIIKSLQRNKVFHPKLWNCSPEQFYKNYVEIFYTKPTTAKNYKLLMSIVKCTPKHFFFFFIRILHIKHSRTQ